MGNCESGDIACPFYQSYYVDTDNLLPSLGADPEFVTFSGFSSGQYMAQQLLINYSDVIKGAALYHGGVYGQTWKDLDGTSQDWSDLIQKHSDAGTIADTSNLKDTPVMIIGGPNDPDLFLYSEETEKLFNSFEANVNMVEDEFVHVFPINKEESESWPIQPCSEEGEGHGSLQNCQHDQAGEILKYLYETLDSEFTLQPPEADWQSKGILTKFAQKEFLGTTSVFQQDGFNDFGWVYYPYACVDGQNDKKCKLHFFMHGCLQSTAVMNGEAAFRNAGFMEYAAANDIIVVFPQNMYNYGSNLFCCWSHQDHTLGDENATNNLGIQNQAFRKMIERLTTPKDESTYDYQGWNGWFSSEGENLADQDPGLLSESLWLSAVDTFSNFPYIVWMMFNFVVFGNLTTW